jgi:hypothetical protein
MIVNTFSALGGHRGHTTMQYAGSSEFAILDTRGQESRQSSVVLVKTKQLYQQAVPSSRVIMEQVTMSGTFDDTEPTA